MEPSRSPARGGRASRPAEVDGGRRRGRGGSRPTWHARSRCARTSLDHVLVALPAEGHVLIEDYPGVGKTALARALSRSIDCQFARVQCTADLLPADIVGTNVYNQREERFEFRPGPIFANVVLVDEINRASPKTQSGLLECMQERQRHRRRPHARARAPVHRARDPEPDRVRGHLSAARGAGRPFHGARCRWATRAPEPRRACWPTTRRGDRVLELEAVATRPRCSAQDAAARVHAARALRDYIVALLAHTRADPRRARREPARRPDAAARGQGARAAEAATTRCPTTSRRSPTPVLAHRSCSRRRRPGVARGDVVADAIARTPAL